MSDGPRIVTVFRNHLRADAAGYDEELARMRAAVATMPGFVEAKTFTADDGERVTLVTFADQASHDGWRTHAGHVAAQERGRSEFYDSYRIQVCEELRSRSFEHR